MAARLLFFWLFKSTKLQCANTIMKWDIRTEFPQSLLNRRMIDCSLFSSNSSLEAMGSFCADPLKASPKQNLVSKGSILLIKKVWNSCFVTPRSHIWCRLVILFKKKLEPVKSVSGSLYHRGSDCLARYLERACWFVMRPGSQRGRLGIHAEVFASEIISNVGKNPTGWWQLLIGL